MSPAWMSHAGRRRPSHFPCRKQPPYLEPRAVPDEAEVLDRGFGGATVELERVLLALLVVLRELHITQRRSEERR